MRVDHKICDQMIEAEGRRPGLKIENPFKSRCLLNRLRLSEGGKVRECLGCPATDEMCDLPDGLKRVLADLKTGLLSQIKPETFQFDLSELGFLLMRPFLNRMLKDYCTFEVTVPAPDGGFADDAAFLRFRDSLLMEANAGKEDSAMNAVFEAEAALPLGNGLYGRGAKKFTARPNFYGCKYNVGGGTITVKCNYYLT